MSETCEFADVDFEIEEQIIIGGIYESGHRVTLHLT